MKRDLRAYARQTNLRLIAGALLLVFVLGDVLIYLVYGLQAALMGLLCIGAAILPVLLVIVILGLIDWLVKKANPE